MPRTPKLLLKGLREFTTHEPPRGWQDWRLSEAKELPLFQDRAGFIIALFSVRTEMYKTLPWDMCILLTA